MTAFLARPCVTAAVLLVLLATTLRAQESRAATRPARAAPEWVTPPVRAPRVAQRTFDSAAAHAKVSYFVFTPDAYDSESSRRFPVEYWLHGSGGGLGGAAPVARIFGDAMRAGRIPPMIVVFPNGLADSMWCDSKDGAVPMETVVMKELIPDVDAAFRTIASRAGRIVEGFSMGGHGSARLGFKHPEVFCAISILGGGPLQEEFDVDATPRADPAMARRLMQTVWGSDQAYYEAQSPWHWAEQNAAALRSGIRIRQVVGDRDATLENNRKFDEHLTRLQIPHEFTVLPGVAHDPRAVIDALDDAFFAFHREALGASTASDSRAARPESR